ncbi:MAG: hypothetical protein ACK42Y_02135 [Candidatus Thermochlorobacter sp.]
MSEKIELRKRRDFGEIISVTFSFFRQNFSRLSLVMLYIGLPLAVLSSITTTLLQNSLTDAQLSGDLSDIFTSFFSPYYQLSLVLTGLLYVGISGAVYSYILRYLSQVDFLNIQVQDVLKDTLSSAGMLLLTSFLLGLFFLLVAIPSAFLLFIPLLYLSIVLSPLLFIRYYEKKNFFEAFQRCFKLVPSEWWKVFGAVFVIGLIGYFIAIIFSFPSMIFAFVISFNSTSTEASSNTIYIISTILSVFSTFGSIVLYALTSICLAFIYFDLVERKEATGLLNRIDQISAS